MTNRFFQCFILWLLGITDPEDNMDSFWLALSSEGVWLITSTTLFTDEESSDYLSSLWIWYQQKAWQEFQESIPENHEEVNHQTANPDTSPVPSPGYPRTVGPGETGTSRD